MRAGADFMAGLDVIDELPAGLVREKATHDSGLPVQNRGRQKKHKSTSSIP
jgi:hypothetical protein